MMHTFLGFNSQDVEGTRDDAQGLVSKSLLQDVGDGSYRMHDHVLKFAKIEIKVDEETTRAATSLQAQYLGRLDVLRNFTDPEHGAGHQGLLHLAALWRSVEELSSDTGLQAASYRASLGELESCEATAEVAECYACVGSFFYLQVGLR